jgi:hypothetical protein
MWRQGEDNKKKEERMMDDIMPELVALVLDHVDYVSRVACRFVCTTWKRVSPQPPPPPRWLATAVRQEEDYSRQVAAHGWLALLQWARANGCSWGEMTCASAAQGGHLDVLEWARANGCPWNNKTCAHAALGGHLEVL